jgi:hypothetical protein
MVGESRYLKGYFYHVMIFFIISSVNILSQDNTNNRMQEKTNTNTDDLKKIIGQKANNFSSDLRSRLNLTESQKRYIYNILVDYYTKETGNQTSQRVALRESKQSLNQETDLSMQKGTNMGAGNNNGDKLRNANIEANTKIESILDNAQRNNWTEVKDSWWGKVKTELYEGNNSFTKDNDIYEEKRDYEDSRDYENYDVYYPGYDIK